MRRAHRIFSVQSALTCTASNHIGPAKLGLQSMRVVDLLKRKASAPNVEYFVRLAPTTSRSFSTRSYLLAEEVLMPALSPTMTEGTITEWKLKEGEPMVPGEVLCCVETDKATVDFEIQDDGVLAKIVVPSGTTNVKVGTIIAYAVEDAEEYKKFAAGGGQAESKTSDVKKTESAAPAATSAEEAQAQTAGKAKIHFLGKRSGHDSVPSSSNPSWMVDWGKTSPSKASAPAPVGAQTTTTSTPTKAPESHSTSAKYTDIPVNNIKKITAKRLTESKATVPHHYASIDVTLDKLMKLRKDLKANGVNLSVNDFILKSAALAMRDVPEINRMWNAAEGVAVDNKSIDIAVAVATEKGLITPIVKDADKKGLFQINEDFKDLVDRARKNKLKLDEFQGGSFSISNLGGYGIDYFSAVINPPQACILAVGGGKKTLVAPSNDSEEPQVATLMTVQLSSDVRVVDAGSASLFLQVFKSYIDNPSFLVL